MLRAYILAAFQIWASDKTRRNWREFWRIKKFALRWQMKDVQKLGADAEIRGPVLIRNNGYIDIGDRLIMAASWYKPVVISLVKTDARLVIEDDVFINYGVEIGLQKEVFIGAKSLIANDCIIYDSDWHRLDGLEQEFPAYPTRIGRGVWLGARVIVLKGVSIGDNTVVAANSTVTSDLPDNVLAGGNPAVIIRPIERYRYVDPHG
jgi:acetyltransferase-like isoleucine patch superfamily enzyme